MQASSHTLINELLSLTDKAIEAVNNFKKLTPSLLNYKQDVRQWSILECIEHLNLYGDFYLPEMEKQILSAKKINGNIIFKSGLIGNYFANLMKGNNGKIKKMASPADKNPANSILTLTTLDRFLKQQHLLKSLLIQSKNVHLTKVKTRISLTPLLRLRLGDTFRFFIYHIERHLQQAESMKKYACEKEERVVVV